MKAAGKEGGGEAFGGNFCCARKLNNLLRIILIRGEEVDERGEGKGDSESVAGGGCLFRVAGGVFSTGGSGGYSGSVAYRVGVFLW
ncbi:hypothetical protein CCP2SC5_410024 [Azospirillaceae bacterium]